MDDARDDANPLETAPLPAPLISGTPLVQPDGALSQAGVLHAYAIVARLKRRYPRDASLQQLDTGAVFAHLQDLFAGADKVDIDVEEPAAVTVLAPSGDFPQALMGHARGLPRVDPCAVAVASVLVSVLFFLLGFVSVGLSGSGRLTARVAPRIAPKLMQDLPRYRRLLADLGGAGTKKEQARALFELLVVVGETGLVSAVVDVLYEELDSLALLTVVGGLALQVAALVIAGPVGVAARIANHGVAVADLVTKAQEAMVVCG